MSFDDRKQCKKDWTRVPVPNLPLCHWSIQLIDLHSHQKSRTSKLFHAPTQWSKPLVFAVIFGANTCYDWQPKKSRWQKNRQCNVEKTWSGFLVSGPTKQKGLGNRLQDWQWIIFQPCFWRKDCMIFGLDIENEGLGSKPWKICSLLPCKPHQYVLSLYVSGKLPTYPYPKLTWTCTSLLGKMLL